MCFSAVDINRARVRKSFVLCLNADGDRSKACDATRLVIVYMYVGLGRRSALGYAACVHASKPGHFERRHLIRGLEREIDWRYSMNV